VSYVLIADSSALVALYIVNKLDVLEKLFGEVYVPRAVYDKAESYKLKNYCFEDDRGNINSLYLFLAKKLFSKLYL